MIKPRGPVPPHYDPDRLAMEAAADEAYYKKRRGEFTWVLVVAACWMALIWVVRGNQKLHVAFARWARQQMIKQGPVYIKLGQMLSTRVDAFSPEVLAELSHLQDKVPPFPFEQVRDIVEADLGQPLQLAFDAFDPMPLAAASMGQVHAARLPSGEDIVVKVLRPNLDAKFATDLVLMRKLAKWVNGHPKLLTFFGGSPATPYISLVDKLGVSMYEQLDLWTEGLSGERFARNFANVPRVGAPKIYWSHTSTRVLAQERIYGFRFDQEAEIRAAGIDYIEMAQIGIRAFTKQVFEDAFFHADSHPGNIFVTKDARLIYVDFGMVEEIDDTFQAQLVSMFVHIIQQRWGDFLEDMVQAGIVPEEAPRDELLPIFTDVWSAQLGYTDKRYTLQEVSDRFYSIVRRYPFRLPERFLFLTRTCASLEGVVYRADPAFKFLPIALPFFAKLVLSRIDMENPWILQDVMSAAQDGVAVERLGELVAMAIADEPEKMAAVIESLVEVAVHPAAAPLREEAKERMLSGGLPNMGGLDLMGLSLPPRAIAAVEAFLLSPEGRDYCVGLLEDIRFPAFAAKVMGALKGHQLQVPFDWVRVLYYWFPQGSERKRAYKVLHELLADPAFPWATMVDPLQQLQMSSTVAKAQNIPALLEFLGQRDTLPLLAKGVVKGLTDRLKGFGTGQLRDPGMA
jgi:predicted unusual protein kinase regulating ubiquinone biosynthesis (AarF/ABC1/UbiB family)